MLRVLVISLFVVNLLLFGFWDKQPEVKHKAIAGPVSSQDSKVPTIHLFSEMVEDQGLLSDNRRCFSLGPFHSIDDLDEVYTSLTEVTVTLSERQTQALVEKGYWAYLPPYSSLLEANEVLLSLQALGMKDIAVIYNGEWTNAISLGYFLRQENAVRRKESLDDRGYAPLIRVQRQAEDRYWLDYEQTPGSDMIALDMQGRPNDFMQRSMPCLERAVIEEPVVEAVEQVATVAQTPDPEPVEIPEEEPVIVAEPKQKEPQQEEDDITTQDDTEQQAEDVLSDPPEETDPQVIDADNISSDEAEQQADEIGNSISQEQDPVQEVAGDVTEEVADTTSEQIDDSLPIEVDEQLPVGAEPASEFESEDAQPDSSTGLPVTIDDETIEDIITDDPPVESERLEFEDYLLEQNPETDLEDDDETGPETDPETQSEPEEDFDPYDGDEIEIDAG